MDYSVRRYFEVILYMVPDSNSTRPRLCVSKHGYPCPIKWSWPIEWREGIVQIVRNLSPIHFTYVSVWHSSEFSQEICARIVECQVVRPIDIFMSECSPPCRKHSIVLTHFHPIWFWMDDVRTWCSCYCLHTNSLSALSSFCC
jgi:hypothetical protein